MTIIVDENISPEAISIFTNEGIEAHHVNTLKSNPKQRISDDQLRRLTIRKGYVLVTMDDDFVRSYVNRKIPDKMIFLYDLQSKHALLKRLEELVKELPNLLNSHDFLEVNATTVKFPFSEENY